MITEQYWIKNQGNLSIYKIAKKKCSLEFPKAQGDTFKMLFLSN